MPRRRRKAYKAELKQLHLNRTPQPTVSDVTEFLYRGARRMKDFTAKCSPATIVASARFGSPRPYWLTKRLFALPSSMARPLCLTVLKAASTTMPPWQSGIVIERLEFYGRCGVTEEERRKPS